MNELPIKDRADPHRRLLRHTYQEGPGFLFLATRGGRPPGPDSRHGLADLRLRARCVRVARDEGIAAALALGVSRASLHRWRARYAIGGLDALGDRPRGPRPVRLPAWVEQAVIVVRLLTYWNSKRLAAEFTRREIYPLDHHAIDGLLAGLGTARPSTRRERGPAYERGRPNELWHIDIKGPFFLRRSRSEYEKVWIVGLVDDHSRFLIGLRVLPQPRTAPILAWLDDCVELCGTPLELMSDDGSPFVVWMPGVLTLFGKTLEELRIRHLRTQVNSPWTNGKIERFWGILQSELLDRRIFRTLDAAADGLTGFASYYGRVVTTRTGESRTYGAITGPAHPVSARYLSEAERISIADGLIRGSSIRAIAGELGRAPSTVSREIRQNRDAGCVAYHPHRAGHRAARLRVRPRPRKLARNPELRTALTDRLEGRWSPEQVSRMLPRLCPGRPEMWLAPETIYKALYAIGPDRVVREGVRLLRSGSGRVHRKRRRRSGERLGRFVAPMVMIDQHPEDGAERLVARHWEGDLITGSANRSAIGTLVERTTRYVLLLHCRTVMARSRSGMPSSTRLRRCRPAGDARSPGTRGSR